jgi:hypothetical protein
MLHPFIPFLNTGRFPLPLSASLAFDEPLVDDLPSLETVLYHVLIVFFWDHILHFYQCCFVQ